MVYPNIHILYIVATQGVDKNPRGVLEWIQSIQRGEDMYINYISREVTRVVTEDVVEGFCVSLTIPVQVVRNIVERQWYPDYGKGLLHHYRCCSRVTGSKRNGRGRVPGRRRG